jgi:hypothetical protein
MTTTARKDPIGDRYYKPLEWADRTLTVLFWISAFLSFVIVLGNRAAYTLLYDGMQIAFVLLVIALFIGGLAVRLYWFPRAEDRRRDEFLSSALDVALIYERTQGYYNNAETDPVRKLAAALMENCFFTRSIAADMAARERYLVIVYGAAFAVAILNRGTDLGVAAIAAQVVFSEQLLSHYVRLEWLRGRCDGLFRRLYDLLQSPPEEQSLNARVLDAFSAYETTKANAAIMLSSRVFKKRNAELSDEWKSVKQTLGLK